MGSMKKIIMAMCLLFVAVQAPKAQAETYVVAADATWPPFETLDENKNVVGYAIDYINAVAKAAGIEIEVRNTAWDGIFAALGSNQCDIIASSVTITEDRKKVMAFTDPYHVNYQALVVREDSDINSFKDLTGKTAGGQIGTTGMLFLPDLNKDATAKTYDEVGLAMEDLKNGRIDAVVCDDLVAYNYAEKSKDYAGQLKIVEKSDFSEDFGFALRKDDAELLAKLNEGIKKVKEDGTQNALIEKWLK